MDLLGIPIVNILSYTYQKKQQVKTKLLSLLLALMLIPMVHHAQTDSIIPEKVKPKKKKQSLYYNLYAMEDKPQLIIDTDLKQLMRKSMKEEYQEAFVTIKDDNDNTVISMVNRLRARGNMRKQQCRLPPIKIDYKKKVLDSLGYKKKIDKLKMVFPCRINDSEQEKMYKEHLIYDLYNVVDSNSLRSKLVDVTFIEEEGEDKEFVGMLLEDEMAYAHRKKAKIVEKGNIRSGSFERVQFLKMLFFQYMIANTDWSIGNYHNIEIVKLPDVPRVVALPYDFDYAGFVGHSYAVPHESLGIKNVHERHFFSFSVTEEEFYSMVEYYLSVEDEMMAVCDKATYLSPKSIKKCKDYLGSFFDLLRKPKGLKGKVVK